MPQILLFLTAQRITSCGVFFGVDNGTWVDIKGNNMAVDGRVISLELGEPKKARFPKIRGLSCKGFLTYRSYRCVSTGTSFVPKALETPLKVI
jgi:hypothetical protein